jgi:hypothetical protein
VSRVTERAVSRHNNVSFVGTAGAALFSLPIDGSSEEMGSWIDAGGIDVVVFCVFAHFGRM